MCYLQKEEVTFDLSEVVSDKNKEMVVVDRPDKMHKHTEHLCIYAREHGLAQDLPNTFV